MAKQQPDTNNNESRRILRSLKVGMLIMVLVVLGIDGYILGRNGGPHLGLRKYLHRIQLSYDDSNFYGAGPTTYDDFVKTEVDAAKLTHYEKANSLTTPADNLLHSYVANASTDYSQANLITAIDYQTKAAALIAINTKYLEAIVSKKAAASHAAKPPALPAPDTTRLPILIYHKTPGDFESQLIYLKNHGYTTISMAEVACGLRKTCPLPPKPVAITFDDGFSDQLKAVSTLAKYNMKATFYLIIGGDKSKHCIGIERISAPCGDSYLNWGEVTQMASSPLVEIGAHTIDHLALASLGAVEQGYQMRESKTILEQHLGRPVTSLAYPYGSFSPLSEQIAQSLGFSNAVSTIAGSDQSLANIYALRRVREAYKLP